MQGLVAFIMRRSITAFITLGIIVALIIAVLHASLCSQLDAILVQFNQQIA
jgi:hypothetical protein